MADLPTFTTSSTAHMSYGGGRFNLGQSADVATMSRGAWMTNDGYNVPMWELEPHRLSDVQTAASNLERERRIFAKKIDTQKKDSDMAKASTRIVRVFLVDPDPRVPVERRVLHSTNEITTDDTDQELFFQLPITELLTKHNAFRENVEYDEKTDNSGDVKRRKGLKPVRIRDLTMTVVTIAAF